MVENFAELRNQLQELWTGLDKKVKIIIISSVIITVIGLLVLAGWASKAEYSVLFNNLSAKDAGEITNQLKEQNINYKLKENGSTILVPNKKVHQLRLDLASQGLPSGGVTGFEIFDRNQLGSTDFEQKVNFYRALGGELSRTVRQMNKVSYAKVQITPSQDSIYQDKEKPAKASVLVKLKEYEQLSKGEIRSIANLVASSVNGLTTDRVTIVDSQSNLLSAKLEEKDEKIEVSDHLELKKKFESEIKKDLNAMLTKVVGMNDFVVNVNTELNFDKRNVKSEEYEPVVDDQGIVRSKQTKEESQEGTNTTPEGVPGTTSNIPQYKSETQRETSSEKSEETVNYEINKQVEEFEKAPGTLERLSVSVMVNSNGELSQERQESIRQAVSAAVGYQPDRGDEISVVGMTFNDDLQQEADQALAAEQAKEQQLLWLIAAAIAGLILLLAVLFFRSRAGEEEEELEAGQEIDYVVEEAEEEFAVGEELSEEKKERQQLIRQLQDLATDQPEELAELIKSWMEE